MNSEFSCPTWLSSICDFTTTPLYFAHTHSFAKFDEMSLGEIPTCFSSPHTIHRLKNYFMPVVLPEILPVSLQKVCNDMVTRGFNYEVLYKMRVSARQSYGSRYAVVTYDSCEPWMSLGAELAGA
jgi:hypothetical protein